MKPHMFLMTVAGVCGLVLAGAARAAAIPKEMTMTSTLPQSVQAPAASDAIRPFKVKVPQAAIDDLRRRVAANVGTSNGAELATYVVEKGKPPITLVN